MACTEKMTQLDMLNSFFCERLMAVAAEIFQAVKDTIAEYQDEINRSKQENFHLRKMLTEVSLSSAPFPFSSSNQVTEARASPPHTLPLVQQNCDDGPLDSESSVIQVKLELSSTHQDGEPQLPLSDTSACRDPEDGDEAEEAAGYKTVNKDEDEDICLDPRVAVKPERRDLQAMRVVELIPCEVQTGSVCLSQFRNSEDEPDPQPSSQCDISHAPSYLQCPTAETLFNFKACGKMLRKDGCVKTHVLVHNKERPFCCDLCGKCYSAAHGLKIHLRTHTGERPYPCKFCMKTFNQKAHVKEHERIHTGEKPYSCSVCGKCFNRTYQVKVHIQNYHSDQVATIVKSQEKK